MDLVSIMPYILSEKFAAVFLEGYVIRTFPVVQNSTGYFQSANGFKARKRFGIKIEIRAPAFAVDPYAVHSVLSGQFLELGYEQLVCVSESIRTCDVSVPCAVRVHHSQIRMVPAESRVQHPGIVDKKF